MNAIYVQGVDMQATESVHTYSRLRNVRFNKIEGALMPD